MSWNCPYPNCDYVTLTNDEQSCPACGSPIYFTGGQDFTELIVDRTHDFTGREWVFAEIDQWLAPIDTP
jgi:Zn-finger protein